MKVFFDVDGVLIAAGIPIRHDEFPGTRRSNATWVSTKKHSRTCTSARSANAPARPSPNASSDVGDFVQYWFRNDSNVNPDVLALVRPRAQGVATYMATGQEHHRAAYLWNDLGLSDAFDAISYSARLGFAKKDPAFFEAINRDLGISQRERPIFFDDPEIVDVAAAKGWDAIRYTSVADIKDHPRLRHLF
jgi:putative hydrolase of the HAD superfamily